MRSAAWAIRAVQLLGDLRAWGAAGGRATGGAIRLEIAWGAAGGCATWSATLCERRGGELALCFFTKMKMMINLCCALEIN